MAVIGYTGPGKVSVPLRTGTGPAPDRRRTGTAPELPPSPEHVFCDIFCDLKPQGFLPPRG